MRRKSIFIISITFTIILVSVFGLQIPASAGGGDPIDQYWLSGQDFSEYLGVNGAFIIAQTFTAVRTYDLNSIELMLEREQDVSPLNVTVAIRAVDSLGQPTGPDLISTTVDCAAITKDTIVTQIFTFSTPYNILAGDKYSIIVYSTTATPAIRIYGEEFTAYSSDDYRGGSMYYSTNSGSSWFDTYKNMVDIYFRTYGTNDLGYDFGDAPSTYSTDHAGSGPYSSVRPGFSLGSSIDSEIDGQPSVDSTGDDITNLDDEDGLTPPAHWYSGEDATFQVFLTNTEFEHAYLSAWIDVDQNGDFQNNRFISAHSLSNGPNTIDFDWLAPPGTVYLRLILHTDQNYYKNYYGAAGAGEVEDYKLTFEEPPQADLGVSLTADKSKIKAGDQVTFTITASNAGPVTATGVSVGIDMSSGTTLVSSNPGAGTFASGVWSGFDLGTGENQTLQLVYQVDENYVFISAQNIDSNGQGDPNSANNSASLELSGGDDPVIGVGGEVQEPGKLSLLMPWLVLAASFCVLGAALILAKTGSNNN